MSVTAAKGFVAAGGHCGIKASGEADLALVVAEDGAVSAAATFTANLSAAAPVQVSRRHLEASNGRAAAVVLNSGNANAATGQQGTDVAEAMAAATAAAIGSQTAEVLVCSTGLIGIPLPFDPLGAGIPLLAASLSTTGGEDAARAILTTDTVAKQVVEEAGAAIVGGMAKGAAMLSPNMATMLAVLTTDAAVEPPVLQAMLAHAVEHSFNRLSVDGCTSTNDTVIALASGRAGAVDASRLGIAMARACARLAEMMALDAEGATKVVRVTVRGAASEADALRAARRVAESQLVKCSFFGADPYWGRVISELGSAGAAFDLGRAAVSYGGIVVCRGGVAIDHDSVAVAAHVEGREVDLTCDLGFGEGAATIITNDLTYAYIDENRGTS